MKKTILYVDDEPINLRLFALNLKRDFNVLTAESAAQGLEKLNTNEDICVVISDMRMPEMNGLEFIMKARTDRSDIKYYILTGYDITYEIAEALANGVINEYFSKPFEARRIIEVINREIESK
ncbi:MAG TPA: response regulator [Tenuifilaceae bacterium]|nr:response regulator [Tenuifilaceae bacterium]HPE19617.1 response regulator [Tenuifilaceae bacterium]HPJ47168.1 response regulator [Tenuifilaceae bacterium]HPQ35775.1 response regulator [Tenuifilaceae bacterium]HRX69455.1 response regulator [Tenuifilaceae bacterium]